MTTCGIAGSVRRKISRTSTSASTATPAPRSRSIRSSPAPARSAPGAGPTCAASSTRCAGCAPPL
jgi:hypothetical protein